MWTLWLVLEFCGIACLNWFCLKISVRSSKLCGVSRNKVCFEGSINAAKLCYWFVCCKSRRKPEAFTTNKFHLFMLLIFNYLTLMSFGQSIVDRLCYWEWIEIINKIGAAATWMWYWAYRRRGEGGGLVIYFMFSFAARNGFAFIENKKPSQWGNHLIKIYYLFPFPPHCLSNISLPGLCFIAQKNQNDLDANEKKNHPAVAGKTSLAGTFQTSSMKVWCLLYSEKWLWEFLVKTFGKY